MLRENIEVEERVLALRERVTGTTSLGDEGIVFVLVRILGRSHE